MAIHDACVEMDLVGLFLIAASLALILLPLGLAPKEKQGWKTPSMVRLLTRFDGVEAHADSSEWLSSASSCSPCSSSTSQKCRQNQSYRCGGCDEDRFSAHV